MDVARTVQKYVDDVLSGKQVAGELQRLAVQRYVADIERTKDPNCPFLFDANKAELAVNFFPQLLKHSTGKWAGEPFTLEPQKAFVLWNLQGFRKRSDGTRRFKSAHIECSRKWGKTTFAAGICQQLFFLDGEVRPEIYNAATKRAQALRCFDECVRMREQQKAFQTRSTVKASEYTIRKADQGILSALGCDGGGSDGLNPSAVIFDELHEWKSKAHRKLWAKLRTGSALRAQPLFITITTAGDDQSTLWIAERKYASQVLRGEAVGDDLFVYILAIDDDDDIFDEECWSKANPLVHTAGFEQVLAEYRDLANKAIHNNETRRDFERYYCNRRVESINRAISDSAWKLGNVVLPVLSGRICYGGGDLGWRDDIAAIGLTFPPRGSSEAYCIKAQGWLPKDCNRDLTEAPFPELIKTGKLIVTPGNTTDTESIYSYLEDVRETYELKSIAIDGNNAREFGTQLVTKGMKVYEFQQSCRNYNEPFRLFLQMLADGKLIHGDCPLMNWCQQNLMTFSNAEGSIMPSKKNSAEKIDPLVAVIMSFAEAIFSATRKENASNGAQIRLL